MCVCMYVCLYVIVRVCVCTRVRASLSPCVAVDTCMHVRASGVRACVCVCVWGVMRLSLCGWVWV